MKISISIILVISATFLLAIPALAQQGYKPMVPIPGAGEITDISDYIKALYLFGLAIVGVVAMLFIIIGGIRYMTAAGNEAGISEAKSQITSAILGLVLVLTSWLILHTINPELVSLKKLIVPPTEMPETHLECVGYECQTVAGKDLPEGKMGCDYSGQLCWHFECKEGECKLITGPGTNHPDCPYKGAPCAEIGSYLDCKEVTGGKFKCVKVESPGGGANQQGCTQEDASCSITNECNDNKDNDGDGHWNQADPCCTNPLAPGNTERHASCAQCDDGKDNDLDGKKDYPEDPKCMGPADNWEGN